MNLAKALSVYGQLREHIREEIEEDFKRGQITLEELEALLENHPDILSIGLRNALSK